MWPPWAAKNWVKGGYNRKWENIQLFSHLIANRNKAQKLHGSDTTKKDMEQEAQRNVCSDHDMIHFFKML